jgi:hypothetical protein
MLGANFSQYRNMVRPIVIIRSGQAGVNFISIR